MSLAPPPHTDAVYLVWLFLGATLLIHCLHTSGL